MTRKLLFSAAALALALGAAPALAQPMLPPLSTDAKAAPAGAYKLDKNHASVTMKIRHLGLSDYTLRFRTLDANYTYDPAQPTASKLQVTIDPRSVDTGDAKFDGEIADKFLEAGQFPTISFASTGVTRAGPGRGKVAGTLTLHGVTRPVTLDVAYNGGRRGMRGEDRMGFSGTTTVRRSDFGVAKALPASIVGDDVAVAIEVEFTK